MKPALPNELESVKPSGMKQLTLTVEDAVLASAEETALKAGKSLSVLIVEWLRQFSVSGQSEFERLVKEEEALRERLRQSGRRFSGGDRQSRDELRKT